MAITLGTWSNLSQDSNTSPDSLLTILSENAFISTVSSPALVAAEEA